MNNKQFLFNVSNLLTVILTLFFQSTYAQVDGVKQPEQSALIHSYQHPDAWSGSKYTTPRKFSKRTYLSFGVGTATLPRMPEDLRGSAPGINYNFGIGHWLAPVHGIEFKFGFGKIPYDESNYGKMTEYTALPNNPRFWTTDFNYLFNVTSFALKREIPTNWELIALLGIGAKHHEQLSFGASIGMRINYNVTPSIDLYIEPKVSVYDNLDVGSATNSPVDVIPSVTAGLSIKFDAISRSFKQIKEFRIPEHWKRGEKEFSVPKHWEGTQFAKLETKRWKGVQYSKPSNFLERTYLSFGVGTEKVWNIFGNLGEVPNSISYNFAIGHWMAPVHGIEVKYSFGTLPYVKYKASRKEYLSDSDEASYHSIGFSYLFNITSFAAKKEVPGRFEVIGILGLELRSQEDMYFGYNGGMRFKYNVLSTLGVYLEPGISAYCSKIDYNYVKNLEFYLVPSITAGVSFKFNKH